VKRPHGTYSSVVSSSSVVDRCEANRVEAGPAHQESVDLRLRSEPLRIERSFIVCETENFSVDESWLSRQPIATGPAKSPFALSEKLAAQERETIEAALRESRGQVFGPSRAATKLGMPRSTLESKIRSLKIDKDSFKTAASSTNN
jgi:DNA-binding NtrC family response regulator